MTLCSVPGWIHAYLLPLAALFGEATGPAFRLDEHTMQPVRALSLGFPIGSTRRFQTLELLPRLTGRESDTNSGRLATNWGGLATPHTFGYYQASSPAYPISCQTFALLHAIVKYLLRQNFTYSFLQRFLRNASLTFILWSSLQQSCRFVCVISPIFLVCGCMGWGSGLSHRSQPI